MFALIHLKEAMYFDQLEHERSKRRLLRAASERSADRDAAFRRVILSIPPGKVSTYGKVAAAAGYPQLHRAVARLLRTELADKLPWHRVVGAGGAIKLHHDAAQEQRARLGLEGVRFDRKAVDMARYEAVLRPWDTN